jgi:hypothetical protein
VSRDARRGLWIVAIAIGIFLIAWGLSLYTMK